MVPWVVQAIVATCLGLMEPDSSSMGVWVISVTVPYPIVVTVLSVLALVEQPVKASTTRISIRLVFTFWYWVGIIPP